MKKSKNDLIVILRDFLETPKERRLSLRKELDLPDKYVLKKGWYSPDVYIMALLLENATEVTGRYICKQYASYYLYYDGVWVRSTINLVMERWHDVVLPSIVQSPLLTDLSLEHKNALYNVLQSIEYLPAAYVLKLNTPTAHTRMRRGYATLDGVLVRNPKTGKFKFIKGYHPKKYFCTVQLDVNWEESGMKIKHLDSLLEHYDRLHSQGKHSLGSDY